MYENQLKLKRKNEKNCENERSKEIDEKESDKKVSEKEKESEKRKENKKSYVKAVFLARQSMIVLLYKEAHFSTDELNPSLPSVV